MPAGLPLTLPTAYEAATLEFAQPSMSFENRKDEHNALAAFIRSSPSLLSQAQVGNAKKSFERPVQIPVIKRVGISLVDGRICDLDGQQASTDMVTITFSVKGFRIKVPTAMLEQNFINAAKLLAQLRYDGWHAWYAFMETNCLAFLEANKTSALVDLPDYFSIVNNAYVSAKGPDFYAAVKYAMQRNLLSANGQLLDVQSGNSVVTRTLMGMNGANNAINQQILLTGGADAYPTNSLIPASGFSETHFLFPVGAVGIYYWLSPNAAAGKVYIPQKDYWWSEKDPMFGYFDTSVHYQANCQDEEIGYNGADEPTYWDIYEYTVDPSFVKSYSSVAGETPIVKYNLTNN